MTLSEREISDIAREAAKKVLESQGTCVSAGMTLARDQQSFRKATPIIFRVNVQGLVSADDLKIPHSELAMHVGAAGKDLIAFALTGTQTGMATYDGGEGRCGFIFGREDELFKPALADKVKEMWEKRGPGNPGSNPGDYVTITDPGGTTFKEGEVVSREAFEKENERVLKLGEKPAAGNEGQASEKRVLVALTRNELDILEGVVREELGLITEGELKEIILKATEGKSSWEGGLTPLLTVLYPRPGW